MTKTFCLSSLFITVVHVLGIFSPAHAGDEAKLWTALRDGSAFAIMRHALAPGTGDPDKFKIGDCSTQRNLSETGRKQARAIGDRFRRNGIEKAQVFTSQWCRCRETAELLELGPVTELPSLNSFFQNFERREPQTNALRNWLKDNRPKGTVILSTHQVSISALTRQFTSSGEIVVISTASDGNLSVLGSIEN